MWLIIIPISLLALLYALLALLQPRKIPGIPTHLTLESDDMNLRATWIIPLASSTQSAPKLTSIEMRTDPSFPFAEVARVDAPLNSTVFADQAPGHYEVRARAFDGVNFGKYSDVASIDLADEPLVPGQVTALVLTQE
jgi:hypothetical protein